LWNGAYGGEMALTTDTMANTVMISRTLGDDQVNGYFSFGGGNISPDAPTGTLVVDLPNVKIYASKLD